MSYRAALHQRVPSLLSRSYRISCVKSHEYVAFRSFNSSTGKLDAAATSSTAATENAAFARSIPPYSVTRASDFLTPFKTSELFLYMVIGAATTSKSILNLCIKAFPYIPIPVIRALVYKIYCGGETIEQVKKTGERLSERGIHNMMISLTIEACNGNQNIDPEYIVSETMRSVNEILVPHTISVIEKSGKDINLIPPGYVALKPTGFANDAASVLRHYNTPEYANAFEQLVAKAAKVCELCHSANVSLAKQFPDRTAPFVVAVIDAEKHDLQEGVYELQRRLYQRFNKLNAPVSVVGTLQMYLSESEVLLQKEEELAKANQYRLGLKLVRGAYLHSEKERTVIHANKEDTDVNYDKGIMHCMDSIMEYSGNESTIGHLVVASHNADSLKLATKRIYTSDAALSNKNKNNIVLGQLLGMADTITHNLISEFKVDNIIKYVAWGPPVETKEYLLRRLEENGDAVRTDNGFPLVLAALSVLGRRFIGRA